MRYLHLLGNPAVKRVSNGQHLHTFSFAIFSVRALLSKVRGMAKHFMYIWRVRSEQMLVQALCG